MTEIYLHIVARMADYMATHPYFAAVWPFQDLTGPREGSLIRKDREISISLDILIFRAHARTFQRVISTRFSSKICIPNRALFRNIELISYDEPFSGDLGPVRQFNSNNRVTPLLLLHRSAASPFCRRAEVCRRSHFARE